MPRKVSTLLPSTDELLRQLGERLRLARLRRRLSAKHVAARAGMAPMTLRSLERGGSGVTMGAYLAAMQVLGVEKDLDLLAKADLMGRSLQDARLSTNSTPAQHTSRVPAPKRRELRDSPATVAPPAASKPLRKPHNAHAPIRRAQPDTIEDSPDRVKESRFTSARALAALLDVPPAFRARTKRR
jgi:transcriptional regulator with XRE-family HTH domain